MIIWSWCLSLWPEPFGHISHGMQTGKTRSEAPSSPGMHCQGSTCSVVRNISLIEHLVVVTLFGEGIWRLMVVVDEVAFR